MTLADFTETNLFYLTVVTTNNTEQGDIILCSYVKCHKLQHSQQRKKKKLLVTYKELTKIKHFIQIIFSLIKTKENQ